MSQLKNNNAIVSLVFTNETINQPIQKLIVFEKSVRSPPSSQKFAIAPCPEV